MNKKTFTTKKKAFSLIELSIVLIIIGLLVAGVTGGASLIKNAELRGLMTEARGYQTAVNAFNERFQALPGDFNAVVGGTFTLGGAVNSNCTGVSQGICGNSNNQIEFYAAANSQAVPAATSATVGARMESNIAWQQLKNGGFVDATFTPANADAGAAGVVSTTTLTPGSNIPGSKVKNAGWIFDFINSQNVVIITGSFAGSGAANAAAVTAIPTAVIIPVDALSIDTKTDDGIANAGKVRAHASTATCNVTTAYATGLATPVCALSFQVDPGQ